MLGPGGKAEPILERISRRVQCTAYHVYKDGPQIKKVLYSGPRRVIPSEVPLEGEVVDPHGR